MAQRYIGGVVVALCFTVLFDGEQWNALLPSVCLLEIILSQPPQSNGFSHTICQYVFMLKRPERLSAKAKRDYTWFAIV
jgi:hypothetical protein